ncbi:hypothetical protein AYO44_10795 [Planctomycetaceae bacterium SCGC AG-212-F19]|nr:hypothetical protein AYO44_10795 [Planctomycetaceae bacterium SCGC AG-212-F19]
MRKSSWLLSGIAFFGLMGGSALAQDAKPMPAPAPAPAQVAAPPVVIGGCCDTGCCNNGCDPRGRVIADVGFMILKPQWKENPAMFLGTNTNNDEGPGQLNVAIQQKDFDFHSQFAPSVSLGYIGQGGWGGRISWWGFAVNTQESQTSDGINLAAAVSPLQIAELQDELPNTDEVGSRLVVRGEVRMDVWDVEAVRAIETGPWSLLASGGVRYAHISQKYNAVARESDEGIFIFSGHNFNGAGPTLALEGRRLLGSTGLYLYGKTRGSLLYGTSKQSASIGTLDAQNNITGVDGTATSRSNGVVPVGELELGAGFQRETRLGMVFLQIGVVGQAWGNIGSAAESSGSPNEELPGRNQNSSVNHDGALGLIGFTLKTGINY